ncbi:MAG: PEGA domain-containing protein [Bacteroidales bacterium]|jgi:hypothetical protein|nr:PEGA domain-containing protein [Bacteroidales bacterium]
MKKPLLTLLLIFITICTYAQLVIDEKSFRQISKDEAETANNGALDMGDLTALITGKKYDDNGILCALLKIRIEKISKTDIEKLEFHTDAAIQIVEKKPLAGEMWVHITGKETDLVISHPSFGKSNKVALRLEGGKTYEIRLTNGETADLTFISRPAGAAIYLDSDYKGKTSDSGLSVLKVPYGEHKVRAELDKEIREKTIEITEASARSISFVMISSKTFTFTSVPTGATLYVDGEKVGITPVNIELSLEYHKIEARSDTESDALEKNFADVNESTFKLNVSKKKLVDIEANIHGARIELDGEYIGDTPFAGEIAYGTHLLRVTSGGQTVEKAITVSASNSSFIVKIPKPKAEYSTGWHPNEMKVSPIGIGMGFTYKRWIEEWPGNPADKYGFWVDGESPDKILPGIQLGLRVEPHLFWGVCLNSGLYWNAYWKGHTYDDDSFTRFIDHTVYVPLHLEYRIQLARNFCIFAFGGLGLDYGFSARKDYFETKDSEERYDKENMYNTDWWSYVDAGLTQKYKRFNYATEYGGGLNIKGIQLSITFSKGIPDLSDNPDSYSLKQNKMVFTLSFDASSK